MNSRRTFIRTALGVGSAGLAGSFNRFGLLTAEQCRAVHPFGIGHRIRHGGRWWHGKLSIQLRPIYGQPDSLSRRSPDIVRSTHRNCVEKTLPALDAIVP